MRPHLPFGRLFQHRQWRKEMLGLPERRLARYRVHGFGSDGLVRRSPSPRRPLSADRLLPPTAPLVPSYGKANVLEAVPRQRS